MFSNITAVSSDYMTSPFNNHVKNPHALSALKNYCNEIIYQSYGHCDYLWLEQKYSITELYQVSN
jgi:hypothetical protein